MAVSGNLSGMAMFAIVFAKLHNPRGILHLGDCIANGEGDQLSFGY